MFPKKKSTFSVDMENFSLKKLPIALSQGRICPRKIPQISSRIVLKTSFFETVWTVLRKAIQPETVQTVIKHINIISFEKE